MKKPARQRRPNAGSRAVRDRARVAPARKQAVQYTVRDVPGHVDAGLRRRAREQGKSLNQVLREALEREAGGNDGSVVYDDLDHLAGQWDEDPEFDRAIAAQDQIDPELWR